MRKWMALIVVVVVSGTGCWLSDLVSRPGEEPTFATEAPEDFLIPTNTPMPGGYAACSWQWATEAYPDITAALEQRLEAQHVPYTQVGVSGFGENCMDAEWKVVYFAAMQTDFEATVAVERLEDTERLGTLAATVLGVIVEDFPVDSTPGPMAGQITITMQAGDQQAVVYVQQDEAQRLLTLGLSGAALWEVLLG